MVIYNDSIVYDRTTAYSLLINVLGSSVDADEFIQLLGIDYDFDQKLQAANSSADDYERLCDAYHSVVCEAINIIDDALDKPRLTNARRILSQVRSALEW